MIRKVFKLIVTAYIFLGIFSFFIVPIQAQSGSTSSSSSNLGTSFKIPCPTKYCTLEEAINVAASVFKVVTVISFAGVILYGGFMRMTSGGNAEKVEQSQKILIAGIIGFSIIVLAQPISEFIAKLLGVQGGLFTTVGNPP